MVDITRYPYFSYNEVIDGLLEPIKSQADVQFINFRRKYPSNENTGDQILIIRNKEAEIDFYSNQFYKVHPLEMNPQLYESGFQMYDHFSYDPKGLCDYFRKAHSIDHTLGITIQYGTHCDMFSFCAKPNNTQVNNFYLNQKDLFTDFIRDFYKTLSSDIKTLSNYKISIPYNTGYNKNPIIDLSPRQQDCISLLTQGLSAKEIGKILGGMTRQ